MNTEQHVISVLAKKFQEHHEKYLDNQRVLDEEYPDRVINDDDDDFSVSLAFCSICKELESLREIVDKLTKEGDSAEVTYKFYLPEQESDVYIHNNANAMYSVLWDLDRKMRSITKHEDIDEDHPRHKLADEVRDMIHKAIDFDKVI
jgi:hypothetical protein